eukprot:m.893446 g.893446  ORF g.893446 m.893446 type:complete len:838 (-) comp23660_c1_seq2:1264-3777(-)
MRFHLDKSMKMAHSEDFGGLEIDLCGDGSVRKKIVCHLMYVHPLRRVIEVYVLRQRITDCARHLFVPRKQVSHGLGKSTRPKNGEDVSVHYIGSLTKDFDGDDVFDSSIGDKPLSFKVGSGDVIDGFNDAILSMVVGERAQFLIQSHKGYGSEGSPPDIPPNAALYFDLQRMPTSGARGQQSRRVLEAHDGRLGEGDVVDVDMFEDAASGDDDTNFAGMFGDAEDEADGGDFDDADDDTSDAAFANLLAASNSHAAGVNAIDSNLSSLLLENQGGGFPAALPVPSQKNSTAKTKDGSGVDIMQQLLTGGECDAKSVSFGDGDVNHYVPSPSAFVSDAPVAPPVINSDEAFPALGARAAPAPVPSWGKPAASVTATQPSTAWRAPVVTVRKAGTSTSVRTHNRAGVSHKAGGSVLSSNTTAPAAAEAPGVPRPPEVAGALGVGGADGSPFPERDGDGRSDVLVVDTAGFIKNAPLEDMGKEIYTLPDVIKEIRDKAVRDRMEGVLPYDINYREPTPASIKFVSDFAKLTGDYGGLSSVDLRVLALTHTLTVERNGTEGVNDAPALTIRDQPADTARTHGWFTAPILPVDGTAHGRDNTVDKVEATPEQLARAATAAWGGDWDDTSKEEDDRGWISEANLAKVTESLKVKEQSDKASVSVGCVTADFAMQNVLLQMGLHVVSIDGLLIRHVKTFSLKCESCHGITHQTELRFCPYCGHHTLYKITVTTDSAGNIQYRMPRFKKTSTRGARYSVPAPKMGRVNNVVVAPDQRELTRPAVREKDYDFFSADRVAGDSPFRNGTRVINSRSGQNIQPFKKIQIGMGRNVNQAKRKTGNKKKK